MKHNSTRRLIPFLATACAAFGLASVTAGAERAAGTTADAATQQRMGATATPRTEPVRITRATTYLGTDVLGTDGRKVGDIVDFVFDVTDTPQLAYTIIMTGGFLNYFGESRAVPAGAIEVEGDTCRLTIGSEEFYDLPVLPDDQQRFLAVRANADTIARAFNNTGVGSDFSEARQLVTFSGLRNDDIYSSEQRRLGICVDAWVSLRENRAPFVEISPTFNPFQTNFDLRYAIPMSRFAEREANGYVFNVTADDLSGAESVSETEGVRMLREGFVGDAVLRVQVAQR